MQKEIFKNWIEAARPKTLAASLSPVIIGCALAIKDNTFIWQAALLCIGVAVLAQIASNFANDYFDYKNGIDGKERLGPERAVSKGKITPKAMLNGALIAVMISCLFGLGLLFYANWKIIFIGIFIAICVFAYSAGPYPLSQHALGDVAVLLFYGIIPVCFTYYVQANIFTFECFLYSIAIGVLSINILIVNNYRDIEQDRVAGKITTAVLFGRKTIHILYLINVIIAITIPIICKQNMLSLVLMLLFLIISISVWIEMGRRIGKDLNIPFNKTARNVLIYALLCVIIIVF
jgi:1,4-dihydroxy-2-naphthoate octaprenyltransferase